MNTFKKICSAILVIVMMLSSVGGINVFADDAEPVVFTDVSADYMYSNAIYSLASEGIISGIKQEDGTYVKLQRGKTKGLKGIWKDRTQKHRYMIVFDKTLTVKWKELPYPKPSAANTTP